MTNVIINNVKEIRFWNGYLPTFLHDVMKYPKFLEVVPYFLKISNKMIKNWSRNCVIDENENILWWFNQNICKFPWIKSIITEFQKNFSVNFLSAKIPSQSGTLIVKLTYLVKVKRKRNWSPRLKDRGEAPLRLKESTGGDWTQETWYSRDHKKITFPSIEDP